MQGMYSPAPGGMYNRGPPPPGQQGHPGPPGPPGPGEMKHPAQPMQPYQNGQPAENQQFNQMSNQMGQMNMQGQPPQQRPGGPQGFRGPGMPPGHTPQHQIPSVHTHSGPPGPGAPLGQPNSQPPPGGMPNRPPGPGALPPTTMYGSMHPPNPAATPGMPPPHMGPRSSMPPTQMGPGTGMPPTQMGPGPGMPPTQMGSGPGMPPTQMGPGPGMPPTQMGSGAGMPPRHMDPGSAQPPQQMGPGPGMPPPQMGPGPGMRPPQMGPGAGMPPSQMGPGAGMPPSQMGPGAGMPPRPMTGPPTSQYNGQPMARAPGMVAAGTSSIPPTSQYGGPPLPGAGMPPTSQYNSAPPGAYNGGMPPAPGQPYAGAPAMGGPPGPNNYMGAPASAAPAFKRLDPDQMPSPIQVILDDAKVKTGVFQTAQRGAVPPLVTTEFTCQDQGNCNPRFLRSTMYNVPHTSEMMKQCKVPFGIVCSPYARTAPNEHPPPLVNLGELGPIRCRRCRAYMSPHMQFIDGGRKFNCPFCTCSTEVPQEYFAHLDHTGRRIDTFDRPELCLGSYEFVATKDYCKNGLLPSPPAFIFMIDVSYNSIKSGLVHLLCQHLREDILPHLPKEAGAEETDLRVGFVTYSNVLHFYNVKANLVQPQMMVVGDVDDMFVPMVDGFLVKPSEADSVIQSLLEQLPEMFSESRDTEVVLGPVIQAGLDALKSAGCPGKLCIFHTSLPICEAPGKLKNRDDRKLLGTEKEKTILTPQSPFYTTLGQECVTHGCGVDLFLFPNAYIDVASIGEVPKLTGGDIYKYEYFTADSHGTRFINDLKSAVSKPIAFDAIVRVRTSTGIRPVDFVGNFYMSNTTDVEMAIVDSDKAFGCEIKHDDKLPEGEGVYVQVAMLFTSISGQRRLRIHNLSLNSCSQMADLFKNVEQDALINFISKTAIRDQLLKSPKEVRETIMNQCAEILACYRRNCASPSSAGQLILPESMKLLPLYTNCVTKSDALQAGPEISTDARSHLMHLVSSLDVASSVPFFYPRLLPLHDVDPDSELLPAPIRCSAERLHDAGAYLLENGLSMFLWLGHNIGQDFIQDVFGVGSLAQINIETCILLELDNTRSHRVNQIVSKVRSQRSHFMKLTIVRQRDKLEPWFNHFLVEDKGTNGTPSYVDYLCHIHKEIRGILS